MQRAMGIGLAAAAALAAGFGLAQEPAAITNPDWLRKPTAEQLFAVWPAGTKGDGQAIIDCSVTVQGTLRQCAVDSESPAGAGFGAAALALAPQFLMRPWTVDGEPVEGRVRIPISFKCPHRGCGRRAAQDQRLLTGLAWAKAPTYQDFVAAYPKRARDKKVGGAASLSCALTPAGGLTRCKVMSQAPLGHGFGDAARALAEKFAEPLNLAPGADLSRTWTRLTFAFDPRMLEPGAAVVGKPKWTQTATAEQALAAFPKQALAEDIASGRAIVRCSVGEAGVLTGCTPTEETPAGKGFGDAAVSLMPHFRLATFTDEGLPVVGGVLRVPVTFRIEDGPADPAE